MPLCSGDRSRMSAISFFMSFSARFEAARDQLQVVRVEPAGAEVARREHHAGAPSRTLAELEQLLPDRLQQGVDLGAGEVAPIELEREAEGVALDPRLDREPMR